jgi:large conductance mechanosensitive channel
MFMSFIKEFKEFAMKGNVMDLAIGLVLGGAFGAIVTSAVDNLLMPIVGALTGGHDISSLSAKVGGVDLRYGAFLQAVITFIIIALFLFMVVKGLNKMKKAEPPAPPAEPSSTDKLLAEIRDALKK